jgi:hypothetical protein
VLILTVTNIKNGLERRIHEKVGTKIKRFIVYYQQDLFYEEITRLNHFLKNVDSIVNFIRDGELCCLCFVLDTDRGFGVLPY